MWKGDFSSMSSVYCLKFLSCTFLKVKITKVTKQLLQELSIDWTLVLSTSPLAYPQGLPHSSQVLLGL